MAGFPLATTIDEYCPTSPDESTVTGGSQAEASMPLMSEAETNFRSPLVAS